jgi:predicted RNase H-like HicB family nuclease
MISKQHRIEIFWSEEDQQWVATLADQKYFSVLADTPEEALQELAIALN